ncbi:MAG TPA: alpha/beta fold hydrolase [Acidimicrobiia bacterium]|nr:alpha/beta fold hydrolase [Acidimicrobiia bacterium]
MIVDIPQGPIGFEQVGAGPDLLLLHSLLTDRRVYDRILPALAKTRRVTLIDLPGYGDSGPAEPHIDHYGDAVGEAAQALELSPDLAIIGNGLGAFVALATAVRHPDRVGRIVLAGVAIRIPQEAKGAFDQMATGALTNGMDAVAEMALCRIFTEEFIADRPDLADERRRALLSMNPEEFTAGCRAIRDLDFRETIGAVEVPTLVVVGSDDQATPPPYGREVAASIPGAKYHELPGVAHGPQLQAPEQFLNAITPFLGIT